MGSKEVHGKKQPLKLLITGGAGFIGTNLTPKLVGKGFDVVIMDKDLPMSTCYSGNAHIELGDIRNPDFVNSVFRKYHFDGVIHLAAVSRVIDAETDPELCRTVGIVGTENIIGASEANGKPWIIFGSSREVYGEPSSFPVKESDGIDPINIYGRVKQQCERMVGEYGERNSTPVMVLRFSNVYGSWFDHTSRVTPLFVRSILAGDTVTINGGGQLFDFTHVDDTVKGIVCAVESIIAGRVINDDVHILTGQPHSLQELVSSIEKATGKEAIVKYNDPRSYDVEKFYGDPTKAKEVIQFESTVTLDEGIKRIVDNIQNKPLRVLKVIHGYPPYYMAGSEVYSYQLANELAKRGIEVGLFTRVENPFIPNYSVEYAIEKGVLIKRVNNTASDYILTDKYLNNRIDEEFEDMLLRFKPDVVHIGHLSHLSTNIPLIAKKYNIPVVMTIHDFWMFCFRGQMINPSGKVCPEPCEENCMACLRDRLKEHAAVDDFRKYRAHMENVLSSIDHFIAPSMHVMEFYKSMGIDEQRITHLRYGFDTKRISYRKRQFTKDDNITFGFTGRILPVKGIQTVIDAFSMVDSTTVALRIYGDAGKYARYLGSGDSRISIEGPYHADDINQVLDNIDVLVVPSEWYEVSPLVIQEATLAGIPVITSRLGGMPELVQDGVNGYLIPPGDKKSLRNLMQQIVDDPSILNTLDVDPATVLPVEGHVDRIIEIYRGVL